MAMSPLEFARAYRDFIKGAGETALTLGSSVVAQPVAGIAGLIEGARQKGRESALNKESDGGQKTRETIDKVSDALTYQPRSDLGRRGVENVSKGIEWAMTPLTWAGDKVGEFSPATGAVLAGAGAVVDPSKGAARAAKAAKAAGKALRRTDEPALPPATPQEPAPPKSIEQMGASKEAREKSIARRAAEAEEKEAPVLATPRSAAERAAVPPDKYRQLYNTQGEDAVVQAALRGEHIRRAPEGGYVGFPRHITNRRGISDMRKSLDRQLSDAQSAIEYAEVPQRRGNWYDRARAGIAETTEPKLLDRTLEQHGVFSAGVAPENELSFALRHGQSRGIGAPQRGFRGAQQSALDDAVAENRPADLQFKIGEYARKNDPRITDRSPFGVNDFRAAQGAGHTQPDGTPWKAGVTDQMHPVMDAEQALVVHRARQAGDKTMTGERAQELPWVLGKAEDLYLQGKFKGATDLESKVNAIREANKTTADYVPKHAFSETYETVPGEKTGHRPDLLTAPFEKQREYARGLWTREPTGTIAEGRDPHARDTFYSALDLRQLPPVEGAGSWMGKQQPLTIARPLVYPAPPQVVPGKFDKKGKPVTQGSVMEIPPEMQATLQAVARMRGALMGQAAVAGNLPVTLGSRSGKTRVLAERMDMNETGNPRSQVPTPDEMKALEGAAGQHGYDVTATSRGALLMPRGNVIAETPRRKRAPVGPNLPPVVGPMPGRALTEAELLRRFDKGTGAADIEAALPGSTTMHSAQEGLYLPALVDERYAGKGVTTARILRDLAKAPPDVAKKLGGSGEVREGTLGLRETDRVAAEGGAQIRDDLQKMREFFGKEDYEKVVALVRSGMKPLAAMTALGFSMQGMAAEPEAPRAGPPRQ